MTFWEDTDKSENIFYFIHKNRKSVKLKKSQLTTLKELSKNANKEFDENLQWHFCIILAMKMTDPSYRHVSLTLFEVEGKTQPIILLESFPINQPMELKAFLASPKCMFEQFESEVLVIEGDYTMDTLTKVITEWQLQTNQT